MFIQFFWLEKEGVVLVENKIRKDVKSNNGATSGAGVVIVNHHPIPVEDYAKLEDDQRDRAHLEAFNNAFGWPKRGANRY